MSYYERDDARIARLLSEAERLIEARRKTKRPANPVSFGDEDDENKPVSETESVVRTLLRRLKRRDETGAGSGEDDD
ncbi:hypothetical protein [Variovorax saccharolyticus]|uniref:hypothetical protein n=1 Tax=Variovorax saccharolyticus TaxID=3053516 RepID=UPI002577F274|nr:hypothetical protein [Variovorax sp. J22R187]MDM0018177.1 hypothetical protein [Variovorax sp. J22R187]